MTAAEGDERPPLTRAGLREAPLSKFQRGLWTLEQWNPGLATYNVPWVFRFHGPADPALLHAALEVITSRHESLRTTFHLGESGPQQVIHDRMPVPFEVTDAPAEEIGALVEATATVPFDLETGPLLRARAIRTPDGELPWCWSSTTSPGTRGRCRSWRTNSRRSTRR